MEIGPEYLAQATNLDAASCLRLLGGVSARPCSTNNAGHDDNAAERRCDDAEHEPITIEMRQDGEGKYLSCPGANERNHHYRSENVAKGRSTEDKHQNIESRRPVPRFEGSKQHWRKGPEPKSKCGREQSGEDLSSLPLSKHPRHPSNGFVFQLRATKGSA